VVSKLSVWQVKQLKKDVRFQRVANSLKGAVDTEQEFREHFTEFDEVAEASMRMYMSDTFKGLIQPSELEEGDPKDDVSEEKKQRRELRRKAQQMLSVPLDELQAEAERERLLQEEKMKIKLMSTLA
jgi:hypothetical protein